MMRETYQICVGTAQPSSAAMRHTHPVNHVNPVTFANADLTRTRPPRNSLARMDNPTVSAYICEGACESRQSGPGSPTSQTFPLS